MTAARRSPCSLSSVAPIFQSISTLPASLRGSPLAAQDTAGTSDQPGRSTVRQGTATGRNLRAMARATTRPAHRGAGSRRSARRSRKTPIRSQTPRRNRAPSRSTAEQRADLLGGSLLALGVFLGFVEYLGWNGGVVGLKLDTGLRLIAGRATAVAPILLVAIGGTIFLQTDVWKLRPLRTGAVVGIATLILALSTTDTADAERHGGLAGSYARIVLTDLVGSVGVSIVVVLGALAALVLITGASVGLLMRSSGRRVARAAEAGARLSGEVGRRVRERPAGRPSLRALPTPPAGDPPLDGSQEFADLYGEIPELSEPPALQTESEQPAIEEVDDEATPVIEVTPPPAAPRTPYRLPPASILARTKAGSAAGQDHERVARILTDALGHFGIEARVSDTVTGPRVTRYELQLAPGTKVAASPRSATTWPTRSRRARSASSPRSPASRPSASRCPTLGHLVTLGDITRIPPAHASPLIAWLGKDIWGSRLHRPGADAAPADRRLHRLRQVRLPQRAPGVDPAALDARPAADDPDRPEEGRAQPLREHPAPADAGRHEHEGRGGRAPEHRARDGEPLRADGRAPRPATCATGTPPGPSAGETRSRTCWSSSTSSPTS